MKIIHTPIKTLIASLALIGTAALAAPPLPRLAATADDLTVSGLSSGAYMAVQYEVAHASSVKGAGIVAGGPYGCAEGKINRALANCMAPTRDAPPPSPARQKQVIEEAARAGQIDAPGHLAKHRVWLFTGGQDHTIDTSVVQSLHDFYATLLPGTAIRELRLPDAGHALPSIADAHANACPSSQPPFINRCRELDAAGEMLAHLLGPLQPRASAADGEMLAFDQKPYVAGKPIDASMADEAYVFVPNSCRAGGCRIHVAFHGCLQSASEIGRRFVDGAGYNAWAASNRLIVLYPQTVARNGLALGSWKFIMNPKGCWDWWGYTGDNYATRNAVQIKAVQRMVEELQRPAGR